MRKLLTAIIVAVAVVTSTAQDKAPELTQAQRDQFTIAVLAKENAEKALRLSTIDYQKAVEHFDKTVAALQVPGYTLQQNRETGKLEYVKKPEPKKETK